ncbi:ABC transporter permease [Ilumatobacter sp.]|uniref:ABC transporter permease n=1 Tax=Ilumatobacter sp. TaxID=1967498 RepID=UPI003C69A1E4
MSGGIGIENTGHRPGTDVYLDAVDSLTRTPDEIKRARNLGIAYLLGAVLTVVVFAQGTGGTATFTLGDDASFGVGAISMAWICAVSLACLGGVQISRGTSNWQNALLGVAAVLFVFTMMAWAAAGGGFSLTGTLHDALKASTPLVFGALGGILCERSGIINIAIEGFLLAGAFTSAVVGSVTNLWIGMIAAMIVSALLALLLAWLAIRFLVDQVIVGFAINFFVLGLTSFVDARVLTKNPDYNGVSTLAEWKIPLLSDIPILGPVLFSQTIYVYLGLALVAIITWALFSTKWGLQTRAVGEHPKAAGTLGVNVLRRRYVNLAIAGAITGFGGSWWTADVGRFNENITNGRGFIALAVVLVGRHHPVGALCAALVFGFSDALALKFSFLNTSIPSEFLQLAPFLVTLIVVASVGRGARVPAALGQPYEKQ